MIVFVNPAFDNQIEALYTHDTASEVWEQLGYIRIPVRTGSERLMTLDGMAVIARGEVVAAIPRINPKGG